MLKSYSRRLFFIVMLFSLVFAAAVIAVFHYRVFEMPEVAPYFLYGVGGAFVILGLFMWIVLKESFKGLLLQAEESFKKPAPRAPQISKKEKERMDRRMFLNLLSVLQREGRLMDFFSENLEQYEDEQIGVAVRSIHDSCKGALDKYLKPKPVIDQAEGEEVTVTHNFAQGAVKLTGNVTGEPPFKGILKHRGWQVSKLDLPELSGSQDSKIISPAEVEII